MTVTLCAQHSDGRFHRGNVMWFELVQMAVDLFPWASDLEENWYISGGPALGETHATRLAEDFTAAVKDGRANSYVALAKAERAQIPMEECKFCDGSGIRSDAIGKQFGYHELIVGVQIETTSHHPRFGEKGWCNGCDGVGHFRPPSSRFSLKMEDIEEFILFLQHSKGFEVR